MARLQHSSNERISEKLCESRASCSPWDASPLLPGCGMKSEASSPVSPIAKVPKAAMASPLIASSGSSGGGIGVGTKVPRPPNTPSPPDLLPPASSKDDTLASTTRSAVSAPPPGLRGNPTQGAEIPAPTTWPMGHEIPEGVACFGPVFPARPGIPVTDQQRAEMARIGATIGGPGPGPAVNSSSLCGVRVQPRMGSSSGWDNLLWSGKQQH